MSIDVSSLNRATGSIRAVTDGFQYGKHMTPDRLGLIRETFIAAHSRGQRMNPIFEYVDLEPGFTEQLDAAAGALPPDEPWRGLLTAELQATRESYEVARTHQAEALTRKSIGTYGRPSADLVEAATELLRSTADVTAEPGDSLWTAAEAGAVLLAAVKSIGVDGWQLDVSQRMAAKAAISGTKRTVRVRADTVFTTSEVRRLIVHEIGTHVLRSVNAGHAPLSLLAWGLGASAATEEGLAVWQEHQHQVATVSVSRTYALRYLACDATLTEDFCGVVDVLLPYTTLAHAFDIAVRVKRGMIDTSQPGGYLKDQVYFGGAASVRAHLAETPDDYPLLMASKWPITLAPLLRELRDDGLLLAPYHDSSAVAEFAASISRPSNESAALATD